MKLDMIIYHFVQELKRRRVFREIVVCGASTLIILEAGINISNAVGLENPPNWFFILLGIGFIIAVWISWIYDITPEGIKKTDARSDRKVPIPKKKVRVYQVTTLISILLIIGLLTYYFIDREQKKKYGSIERSIAVLPLFDVDLSRTKIRDFEFVGHRITTCLMKIKDYHVVPWEDCRKYTRSGKDYSTIGDELSAAVLVDWRPHESEDTRNLTVDLINSDNGEVIWSDNYRIEGSWADEICKYSKSISKGISRKLRVYPTLKERALVNEEPRSPRATMYASLGSAMTTDSWEMTGTGAAGIDNIKSEYIDSVSFDRAIQYFTDAIDLDTSFAEAYAKRAIARLWGIRYGLYDHSELGMCEKDIETAFRLEPDLPEANAAMGFYYYYGVDEYELALVSFEKAAELQPSNYEYLFYLSVIWRRLDNWDNVKFYTDEVFESRPLNVLFLTNMGISYMQLREFSKSIECQDRAIKLNPSWYAPYINKIDALMSLGNIAESKIVLKEAEERSGERFFRIMAVLDLYDRNYQAAVENIEQVTAEELFEYRETEGDLSLLKAKIYKYAGDTEKAKVFYLAAVDYFERQILFNPGDYISHSNLGLAYAGLGERIKSREHAERAFELIDQTYDGNMYPYILYDMIQVYTLTGDHDSARELIDELLSIPSAFTSEFLALDPDLQPLR